MVVFLFSLFSKYICDVAVQRLSPTDFLEHLDKAVLIDVRSPAEYKHAQIPGAKSLALFSDEERKIVGTAYKQESREQAIKIGLDFFGPKMRGFVEEAEGWAGGKEKPLAIYCWRGGMRSGAVSWLMDLYGFKVYTLAGGYKAYRNEVLKSFGHPIPLKVLGGYTGSGKTVVLKALEERGEPVLDLEAIASHRGSAFGAYKMNAQPAQEMFENLLFQKLYSLGYLHRSDLPPLWVEDESQRIGDLNVPISFWQQMRRSPIYFLDIPFEKRLDHIIEDYGDCSPERLIGSIERIAKRLGPQHAKAAIELVRENNIKEAFRILLLYYDKRYLNGLHNRENLASLLTTINSDSVGAANVRSLS